MNSFWIRALCMELALTALPIGARAETHVLAISGGMNASQNEPRYFHALVDAYDYYKSRGIPNSQLTVLAAQPGTTWDAASFRGGAGNSFFQNVFNRSKIPKSGGANSADLEAAFKSYSEKLKAGDTLEIFITDHGFNRYSGKPPEGKLSPQVLDEIGVVLWGENLSVNQFQALFVKYLSNKGITVRIQGTQCYSGALHQIARTFNEGPLEGPTVCAVSSQSMWLPAGTERDEQSSSVALFAAKRQLQRKSSNRKTDLFTAGMQMISEDRFNDGMGMLSSLGWMQASLGIDDFAPNKSDLPALMMLERQSLERLQEMTKEPVPKIPAAVLADSQFQRCVRDPKYELYLGVTQYGTLDFMEELQKKIWEDELDLGFRQIPGYLPKFNARDLDVSRIPGLSVSDREKINALCKAAREGFDNRDFREVSKSYNDLKLQGDTLLDATRVSGFQMTEAVRTDWLAFYNKVELLKKRPEMREFRKLGSQTRYCRTLHAYLSKDLSEKDLKGFGRTLKCELSPML